MQPKSADPTSLDNLYDIVVPAPIQWWPPAPGWYVVAGILLAALLWLCWHAWRSWNAAAYRRAAIAELNKLRDAVTNSKDKSSAIAQLAAILKRTALAGFPRGDVAQLSGAGWLEFLDRTGKTTDFTQGTGQLFGDLQYNPRAAASIDSRKLDSLFQTATQWIRTHSVSNEVSNV